MDATLVEATKSRIIGQLLPIFWRNLNTVYSELVHDCRRALSPPGRKQKDVEEIFALSSVSGRLIVKRKPTFMFDGDT